MRSVMSHDFSRVPLTAAPRSAFDRSHGLKTAFDSGYLVPIEVQEVLPGDKVDLNAHFFARLGPVVTPPMDNVFLDTQWFFVPSRLLWSNFTKMMGERVNPKDSIDYLVPQLDSGSDGFTVGSLADYFGIPTGVGNIKVNALPFRAYAKIWDDWYRDENLQDSIIQSSDDLGDSNGTIAWNTLRKRGKRHDYFTSSLPWPQKGDAVEVPLVGDMTLPVHGDGKALGLTGRRYNSTTDNNNFGLVATRLNLNNYGYNNVAYGQPYGGIITGTQAETEANIPAERAILGVTRDAEKSGLVADFRAGDGILATINSLRMAFQIQRLLETDARSGTRFVELIRAHFKTVCPDARLQRSEYLGGSSQMIAFNQVPQTSATGTASTPQGNLTANGVCTADCRWSKAFTEHGYIIGLANVRCDLNYQQGLNRMWSRRGRYDFFWPTLQNLGEQEVKNIEIYAVDGETASSVDPTKKQNDMPFGYQERYAEYRYNPSMITGKMRSSASGSLDVWHLAQHFSELPTLSAEFIEDSPPLERILAVHNEPQIILDAYLGQRWERAMGTYSVPGLIDHL